MTKCCLLNGDEAAPGNRVVQSCDITLRRQRTQASAVTPLPVARRNVVGAPALIAHHSGELRRGS